MEEEQEECDPSSLKYFLASQAWWCHYQCCYASGDRLDL